MEKQVINSPDNKLIKHACSLKHKKFRDESGEFLAEGISSVADLIKADFASVKTVFVAPLGAEKLLLAIDDKALEQKTQEKLVTVSEKIMQKLSDTATPQQIVAIVQQKSEGAVGDFCVYLDRIRDPGNLGTIIRTAAAAGYSLILRDCADIFSPKVVRSSMSAIGSVDFLYADPSALDDLKNKGYAVIAADASGQNLFEFDHGSLKNGKVCIVIGNEAQGIADEIFALATHVVSIPMQKMESLNAAVSSAIMMYQFRFMTTKN